MVIFSQENLAVGIRNDTAVWYSFKLYKSRAMHNNCEENATKYLILIHDILL